jgi:DNA-binding NarL/FixJ family response regulator
MTTITAVQEERAIAEVRRLSHAGLPASDLLRRVARVLHRVAPFDIYAAATIDPASNLITSGFAEVMGSADDRPRPVNPGWFDQFYFAEGFDQTIALLRRGRWATTIAEETNGHLERSLCYRESMRPAGIEHKLHVVFVDRRLWGDMELYREKSSPAFSPREIELVRRIATDVGTGLRVAALHAQTGIERALDTAPGVLVIDHRGAVTVTAAAERLLAELADAPPNWRELGDLPAPVHAVLAALRQTLTPAASGERDVAPHLRVRGRNGRWLSLHASGTEATETRSAERVVVIAPAQPQEVAWLGMAAYHLSSREEEVVKLVVAGLTTRQISERLFIAEHTVQRHFSNIFEKVGVRSRRELVKHLFVEQMLPHMN